jgi:hypothetical protein
MCAERNRITFTSDQDGSSDDIDEVFRMRADGSAP